MNTFLALLILSVLCVASGCGRSSEYPGYRKARHGIYYQLHTLGEDTIKARQGDYITIMLTYMTVHDSVFFQGARKLQVNKPAYDGAIDECFTMLAEDESATFIILADDFFTNTLRADLPRFITPGDPMKVKIEMIEIQTKNEYFREKEAFLSWIQDFSEYEKVILKQYLLEEKLNVNPLPSGIYYLNLRPGTGKKVELGDTVTVDFEGRFINGKFFDSTIKRRQPFQFVYGTEWQIIKGLEEAIGMMHEGEKSLFILPSELGFGNEGSSDKFIPPYTSLIFEVEILKVSSPA